MPHQEPNQPTGLDGKVDYPAAFRRTRRVQVYTWVLGLGAIAMGVFGVVLGGPTRLMLLLLGGVTLVGAVGFYRLSYRCPKCGAFLGLGAPDHCPSCGVRLRKGEEQTL